MLPNLGLWLTDDVGLKLSSSGFVANWDDQSGHANVASAGGGSTFTVDPGIVNGRDAVANHGNVQNLAVLDAPSLQFGTSGFVIGAVVRTGKGDLIDVYSKGQTGVGGAYSLAEDVAGDYVFTIGTQSIKLTPTDYGHFHYVIAWSTTTGMQIQSDGVAVVTGVPSALDVSQPGVNTYVLANNGGVPSPPDELAEIVAAKGPVSCSDIANLVAYFTARFAL